MATLAFALLIAVTLSAPAPPPGGPCPTAPANYCDCGIGVNTKWICRANNGYVWETNDDAPKDPCPAKYPICTTHPGEMATPEFFTRYSAEYCIHEEDLQDHKCFEACAASTFKTKGIEHAGKCPTKYTTVDKTTHVQQCADGVTNPRYCHPLNVTITTKGESPTAAPTPAPTPPPTPIVYCSHQEDTVDHKCFEACSLSKFETKGINGTGKCPAKYNEVDKTTIVKQCPDGVTNPRYCNAINVTIETKGESGGVEALAMAAPTAPLCFHMEDVEDHKCFEACSSEGTFKTKGISATGTCPAKYNSVDTTKVVLQCPDGVTNVRYCAATALNVSIATKGEAGGFEALMAMSDAQIITKHKACPCLDDPIEGKHCEDMSVDLSDAHAVEWWGANKYAYADYQDGLCDTSAFPSVERKNTPAAACGVGVHSGECHVVLRRLGKGPVAMLEAAPAPAPLVIHLQDPKEPHCSDLTVDFSMESDLDQVKEWWSAKKYMYTAWAKGPCDAKFNSVDHVDHPIGVAGVTTREKGIKQSSSMLAAAPAPAPVVIHLQDPKEPHCSDLTIDFSMESDLDQVKEWWSAKKYMYTAWAKGPCDAKFNSVDHVDHPIGVAGVTTREKGIKQLLVEILEQ